MKNACLIHINFLSLLFALRSFVICGETAYRLCGIEPMAHALQTSLERPGFLLKVMFVPQAGFSAGVNVFTSHKAEAAAKTHHFRSKNCDETVTNNVFSTGMRRV